MLTQALGSGGILHSVQVGLYTNLIAPVASLTLADLVEPTYGGYSRQAATFLSPWVDASGNVDVTTQLVQFQPTDSSASSTIVGAFVASAHSGGNLITLEQFAESRTLATPSDSVEYALEVSFTASKDYGSGTVID